MPSHLLLRDNEVLDSLRSVLAQKMLQNAEFASRRGCRRSRTCLTFVSSTPNGSNPEAVERYDSKNSKYGEATDNMDGTKQHIALETKRIVVQNLEVPCFERH